MCIGYFVLVKSILKACTAHGSKTICTILLHIENIVYKSNQYSLMKYMNTTAYQHVTKQFKTNELYA